MSWRIRRGLLVLYRFLRDSIFPRTSSTSTTLVMRFVSAINWTRHVEPCCLIVFFCIHNQRKIGQVWLIFHQILRNLRKQDPGLPLFCIIDILSRACQHRSLKFNQIGISLTSEFEILMSTRIASYQKNTTRTVSPLPLPFRSRLSPRVSLFPSMQEFFFFDSNFTH